MIEQMRISRSLGADGVVFFSSSSLNQPFLDKLKALNPQVARSNRARRLLIFLFLVT